MAQPRRARNAGVADVTASMLIPRRAAGDSAHETACALHKSQDIMLIAAFMIVALKD